MSYERADRIADAMLAFGRTLWFCAICVFLMAWLGLGVLFFVALFAS